MLRRTRLCGFGLALTVAAALPVEAANPAGAEPPKPAASAPAAGAVTPGLRLVRALNLRPLLDTTLASFFPPGEAAFIAGRMIDQDKDFLAAFEAEAAGLYERRFSPDELRRLADFLETDLGRKWIAEQPGIMREQLASFEQGKSSVRSLGEIGCAAALLAPALAKAKEKGGLSGPGLPAEYQARFDALIPASRGFCGCLFREAEKKGKSMASLRDPTQARPLAQDIVASGACPLPSLEEK